MAETAMVTRAIIKGTGMYLPEKVLTNADMAQLVDTTPEWIFTRTGILQRHKAADDEVTSDLATAAARMALENANMRADEIDMIIVATSTPDRTFPSTATYVQQKLGMTKGAAFDVQAVCSGFVYGLGVADSMIGRGLAKNILLIGAETMTRLLNWQDRTTCILFGDGAGCVVLQAAQGDGTVADTGILSTYLQSDGRKAELLYVDGGTSFNQQTGFLVMNGKEVFRHAVTYIADAILQVLNETGLQSDDIDWFIPHQANQRIISAVGQRIGLDEEKIILTVGQHANTSAASIPLAFSTALADGRIKKGDLVMFEAMGGGLAWGASLARV
ncbi:MAG: ketoacyl-ACP synthase III [Alphaproteobacteria bacterium]|nr:ketoacyl-ACP synthase III [Alphaproteobacteria bacterium]